MLKPIEIKEGLFYVGLNDRTKHLFENLWPIPKGVSYNSYLIVDEQTVLFDTVDICYSDLFLNKLEIALKGRELDYIVINHMEPDHSGSLGLLRNKYPNVKIVGNKRTLDMVEGYHRITDNTLVIEEGSELRIGKRTLRFYLTPMVHWPETMMTYEITDKVLFSGDAFGTFGTLDGGIIDTQLPENHYYNEMIRYYSNVVGKFGNPVQKALAKLANIEIDYICSTHGPIWTQRESIEKVISIYDKLSRYEGDEGVVIAYGSMYGNTEQIAETIAYSLAEQGIKHIFLHNVSKREHSYIIRDVFKYRGLIIGSPTYNNKLFPEVANLISLLEGKDLKNRIFGYFGSFTWAGAAVKNLKEFAEKNNFDIVGPSIEMKQTINMNIYEEAMNLGKAMADRLKLDR